MAIVILLFTCGCGSTSTGSAASVPAAGSIAEQSAEPTAEASAEPTVEPTAEPSLVENAMSLLVNHTRSQATLEEALSYAEEAAASGDPNGQFLAGYILDWEMEAGSGQDFERAYEYYTQCADSEPYANLCLAILYKNGQGVDKDVEKGAPLVEDHLSACLAADESLPYEPIAYNLLGSVYYYGIGVEQNYEEAVKWYRLAADQGYADAQNSLGDCYYEGHGVEQNYEEAVEWFTKAADQGNSSAQDGLGACYYHGQGVEQNYAEAVEWFTKAADQGNSSAQKWLGYCYENGFGIEQNQTTAQEWYSKAEAVG